MSSDTQSPPLRADPQPLQRANTLRDLKGDITDATYKAAANLCQATRDAINADVPLGAWAAAAEASSKAPTLGEIRKGSFAESGWIEGAGWQEGTKSGRRLQAIDNAIDEDRSAIYNAEENGQQSQSNYAINTIGAPGRTEEGCTLIATGDRRPLSSTHPSPPMLPWARSTMIGLQAFRKWFLTPAGFLVTVYALNVVAWGGMLFLLLCKAAPEMCWALDDEEGWVRDCNHLYSSRRIWLEIDSQILNALFCVTGFGLIPWRFRDLYYLLRWRLMPQKRYGRHQKLYGLRTLGGIYKNWVRLPGSDTLDDLSPEEYDAIAFAPGSYKLSKRELDLPSVKANALDPRVPWKLFKTPPSPLTGVRAPPTDLWKIDIFVWCNVWNTFFQGCLCGFMWGMSRFDRPSWSTGLFIGLACVVSGAGGILSFMEGRKIKRIEGVQPDPTQSEDYADFEQRRHSCAR